jgi:hypothetical protein
VTPGVGRGPANSAVVPVGLAAGCYDCPKRAGALPHVSDQVQFCNDIGPLLRKYANTVPKMLLSGSPFQWFGLVVGSLGISTPAGAMAPAHCVG